MLIVDVRVFRLFCVEKHAEIVSVELTQFLPVCLRQRGRLAFLFGGLFLRTVCKSLGGFYCGHKGVHPK